VKGAAHPKSGGWFGSPHERSDMREAKERKDPDIAALIRATLTTISDSRFKQPRRERLSVFVMPGTSPGHDGGC
jgi:hypothetical protein